MVRPTSGLPRFRHLGASIAIVVLFAGPASRASALGDLPFQVLLNADGSGNIVMNNGSRPSWKACRPNLTECTPFATGSFDTGEAMPETVFWAGGELLTPIWKGNVHPTSSPTVTGKIRANDVVRPVAGQWSGRWGDDYDQLTLAICRTATGQRCLTVNHEGPERACGSAGATLIDPAFTGWYLRVTDHRYGSGTVFAGVGHLPYFKDQEPVPGPTVAVAMVGRIAAPSGAPEVKCGPPPLTSGSIDRSGSAKVGCRVLSCRATLVAQRNGGRVAKLTRKVPAEPGFPGSTFRTIRFKPSALNRLGNGPVRLKLRINGRTVVRRTVNGELAEHRPRHASSHEGPAQ